MLPRARLPLAVLLIVAAAVLPAAAASVPIPPLPPMPPTDLRAAYDGAAGAVTLEWSPAPGEVEAYAVYRNGALLGTATGDGRGFTDAAPAAVASYTVTALAAGGESVPSNPAVVALPPVLPGADATEGTDALVADRYGPGGGVEAVLLGWRMCSPLIVGGMPPSAHVDWACIDVLPLEG